MCGEADAMMPMDMSDGKARQSQLIDYYRKHVIRGKFVDLVPADESFTDEIVSLRNTDRARHAFNQTQVLTAETQNQWFEQYRAREDDLYWCVCNKQGEFIGTFRVYDIDMRCGEAEWGSEVIKENIDSDGPYIAETILMSARLMFDPKQFDMKQMIMHIRAGNDNVISTAKKLGGIETERIEQKGALMVKMMYNREAFRADKLDRIIDGWTRMKEMEAGI